MKCVSQNPESVVLIFDRNYFKNVPESGRQIPSSKDFLVHITYYDVSVKIQ